MRHLTSNDKNFGPFTWGPWRGAFGIVLESSGDDGDNDHRNKLRLTGFGWALRIILPEIIRPFRIKHMAETWDAETVKRLGRNWYYEVHERQFGFSLSDMGNGYDFLQIFFGAQTHSSDTTKSWCKHLPWKQWRHVRTSVYFPDGFHFATEPPRGDWFKWHETVEQCPTAHFGFADYDGELIVATCLIEEMEWKFGCGWFKWLSWFRANKIWRSLDLKFSAEVGPEKGSWKGGTTGHGIDMLPGETPEAAFRRYCEIDHERKGRKFKLRFIGPCNPPPPKPTPTPTEEQNATQSR